jgi:hypothetical protein
MSVLRFSVRRALVIGVAGILSINATACGDTSTNPRPMSVVPSATIPMLSSTDRALLDSLRAPVQWVAELHHAAMQEVLHDPNISRYTGAGPSSPACAAQTRYMQRYARRLDTLLVAAHASPRRSDESAADIAPHVGICRTSLSSRVALPNTAAGRYAASLIAAIRAATSLDDALSAADVMLLGAAHDPSITHDELSAVAALTTLARSSAMEWYTHAQTATTRALNAGRQPASWNVSAAWDLDGCGFLITNPASCVIGGIGGSLFSW